MNIKTGWELLPTNEQKLSYKSNILFEKEINKFNLKLADKAYKSPFFMLWAQPPISLNCSYVTSFLIDG